eukprot:TRINITY_DN2092_c0_g1_i2.p2 TRINITY_DN2092_c0_g1~~TRINITY_DN2092_c0_g1_i2.p2  ORF type:complete len:568 (-),score=89.44 TRINITY_DN2092_c0_g1_i2:394-2097(-)
MNVDLHGTLSGYVIQGRNLTIKGNIGDPYCVFGLVDADGNYLLDEGKKKTTKKKTNVLRRTTNPIWKCFFEFELNRPISGLSVTVMDKEKSGFMGTTLIDQFPTSETTSWFKLHPKPGTQEDSQYGEIQIQYCFDPSKSGTMSNLNKQSYDRSELEEEAMHIIRVSGGPLILIAMKQCPKSQYVQRLGSSSLFKWSSKATLASRELLLQEDVLDVLYFAAKEFFDDHEIVFYALGCFTFFTDITESKQYFKDEYCKLLVSSIQNPPKLLDKSNASIHVNNCLISLCNICSCNFDHEHTDNVSKCQKMSASNGGTTAALKVVMNYKDNPHVQRTALLYLLKCSWLNNDVRELFLAQDVVNTLIQIYLETPNVMFKWIILDVFQNFSRSNNLTFAKTILPNLSKVLKVVVSESGPHRASFLAAKAYFVHALLPVITDNEKKVICDTQTLNDILSSFTHYQYDIPKMHQKNLLSQRVSEILLSFLNYQAGRNIIIQTHSVNLIGSMMVNSDDPITVKSGCTLFERLIKMDKKFTSSLVNETNIKDHLEKLSETYNFPHLEKLKSLLGESN